MDTLSLDSTPLPGVGGSPSLLHRLQHHRANVPTEHVGRMVELRMLEQQLETEKASLAGTEGILINYYHIWTEFLK